MTMRGLLSAALVAIIVASAAPALAKPESADAKARDEVRGPPAYAHAKPPEERGPKVGQGAGSPPAVGAEVPSHVEEAAAVPSAPTPADVEDAAVGTAAPSLTTTAAEGDERASAAAPPEVPPASPVAPAASHPRPTTEPVSAGAAPSPLDPALPRGVDAAPMAAAVVAPAPAGVPSGSPSWLPALWAVPLLGVFGAVLAARRRDTAPRAIPLAPVTIAAPPETLKDALLRGHAATKAGDLVEALACFDAALRMAPGLGVALFCRGVCLASMGRMAEAYAALEESVMEDPTDGARRVHLARVALALGRAKDAMDILAPLARDAPQVGDAMFQDAALAGLRDHPRFLALCGRL